MPSSDAHPLRRGDYILTGVLLALAFFTLFVVYDVAAKEVESPLPEWGSYLLTAALICPMLVRRRFPLATGVFIGALFPVYRLLEVPEGSVSSAVLFIAIFAVGVYGSGARRRNQVRALIVALGFVALFLSIFNQYDFVSFDGITLSLFSIGINVAFFAAAWLLGEAWRQRQEYAVELEIRADELAREREERAKRAVLDERVRIARELHDVVAHHVSVMGVQAAGARRILDSDPDRASIALASVEESSRQAVSELQRLVGVLRSDSDGLDAAPQPTLGSLQPLVDKTKEAGLPVELRRVGRSRPLPSSVELSAYRIVQESLTNVLKHAPGASTTVVLTFMEATLGVEIVNQASPNPHRSEPGGGRGMVGMRERAAMLGGDLQFGPAPGGGFRVAATLPTGSSYDAEAMSAS